MFDSSTGITWRVELDQRTDDQFRFGGRADDVREPLRRHQFVDRTADGQVVLGVLDVFLPQNIDRLFERLDIRLAAFDELLELRKAFFQQLRPVLLLSAWFMTRVPGLTGQSQIG